MIGVLRILIILIALYYVVRFLGRIFKPLGNKSRQSPNVRPDNSQRKEGEVRIEYTDKNREKREKSDSGQGEYIDFEELDKS